MRRLVATLAAAALAVPVLARASDEGGAERIVVGANVESLDVSFWLPVLNREAAGTIKAGPALLVGAEPEDPDAKVVVLSFMTSWCEPCKKEMPELQKLHEKYKDRGLRIVGVDIVVPKGDEEPKPGKAEKAAPKKGAAPAAPPPAAPPADEVAEEEAAIREVLTALKPTFPVTFDRFKLVRGKYVIEKKTVKRTEGGREVESEIQAVQLPSVFVLDSAGTFLYVSKGYREASFKEMVALIETKLGAAGAKEKTK